jgi:hypothetical protein
MLQSKFALPVELWSNITTEDEPEDEPEMRQTLLSVSHTFKSIVDNTAQLWTRLSFNCKDHFMQASSLLQKSHSLPLDIRISFFDLHLTTNDQVTLGDVEKLARLLNRQSYRLRVLQVNVSIPPSAEEILTWICGGGRAPILERLGVILTWPHDAINHTYDLSTFKHAPRMACLHIGQLQFMQTGGKSPT